MAQSIIHTAFNAGELSKNLYGRVDLDKYHSGAALLENFFVDYRGGASSRMGTEFIARCKSNGTPRIIGFSFNTAQTYVLEFGEQYLRILSEGAQLIASTTSILGITQANTGVIHTGASIPTGTSVFISGIVGMTQLNGRTFTAVHVDSSHISLLNISGGVVNTTGYDAWVSGGTVASVLEIATPYAEADLPLLKFAQSADTMTLTHPNYPPQLLKRTGASTFTLSAMVIGPTIASPTALTLVANSPAVDAQFGYVVTAISLDGKEESLPCLPAYVGSQILDNVKCIKLSWIGPAADVSHYNVYKYGPEAQTNTGANRHSMGSIFGFIGQTLTIQFTDTNIAPDYTKQPPAFNDPFAPGQIQGPITITAPGSGWADTVPPTAAITGGSPVTNGQLIVILDDTGAVAYIPILQTGSYKTVPSIVISGGAGTGATATIPSIGPLTGTYPGCVSFFQQRQCFAASANNPQSIWLSQTGSVFNFDQSLIPVDSDGITIALASRQVNQIKALVPVPTGLIALTTGGGWLISGGGQQLAVTPIDISAQPQASTGANDMPPLQVNNNLLYVQSRGAIVRDFVYNFYINSYFGNDRSALANHLFFGYQLLEWSYAEEPFRSVWIVRNDGAVLCFTYVPEQEVYAWSHHTTQGNFISTCSVVEGQEDVVYFIVKRFVNGAWVNYIERLFSRNFYGNAEFPFCLDSGLQLTQSAPNATLTLSAATGTVTASASAAVFTSADTGKVLRGRYGGKGIVTFINSTTISLVIEVDGNGNVGFPTIPNEGITPQLLTESNWFMAMASSQIRGLDHLVDKTVSALADGVVYKNLVVDSDGVVTLPNAASFITVGLSFIAKLQTLYLDTGEPTIQGKRKFLPRLTARVEDTRGIQVGPTFDNLVEYSAPSLGGPYAVPTPLITDDLISPIPWDWTKFGQVCVLLDYPLPATILGLIPEVVIGDTGR